MTADRVGTKGRAGRRGPICPDPAAWLLTGTIVVPVLFLFPSGPRVKKTAEMRSATQSKPPRPGRGGPSTFVRGGLHAAASHAPAFAVELHGLAAERGVDRHFDSILESGGLRVRPNLAILRRRLVGMRGDHGIRLYQLVYDMGRFLRAGGENAADIHDHQLGAER